jgi:hypothetical protein
MVRKETIEAFISATKLRAKAYAYFFEEIVKACGHVKAKELCSRATYRLGLDKASEFRKELRNSALSLAEAFVADPVGHAVFKQQILSGNEKEAVIEMKYCPLVDMWQSMKLHSDLICTLCDFAHRIDYGTIEGAGFNLSFKSMIARGDKSCVLHIFRETK